MFSARLQQIVLHASVCSAKNQPAETLKEVQKKKNRIQTFLLTKTQDHRQASRKIIHAYMKK